MYSPSGNFAKRAKLPYLYALVACFISQDHACRFKLKRGICFL